MSDDVLVLWDIDGTLLNAGGVGRDLYGDVFLQLFGRPLTAFTPMSGRTDRAIILETLELAGVEEPRRHVDPFIASLGAHAQEVHAAVAERGHALPGAAEVLAAVAAARSFGSSRPVGTSLRGVSARGVSTLSLPEPGSPVQTRSARSSGLPAPTAPAAVPAMAAHAARAAATSVVHTVPATVTMAPSAGAQAAAAPAGAAMVTISPVTTATVPVAPQAGPVIGAPVIGAPAVAAPALGAPALGAPALGPQPGAAPPVAVAALAQLVPPQAGRARGLTPHQTAPPAATGRRTAPPRAGAGDRQPKRRVYQSVLTGSIRPVAEMKLAALGLRDGLDLCIGAYGDDHEDRTQLVHVARRRAAGVHGQTATDFSGTSTVIVGDTPLDVSAALAAGARVVGVATGVYSEGELREAGALTVLPDLTDTAAVLDALFG
jgi:phosphoglycolate phosphatase-like HAD superfamily hydrolase